jgi:enterochelin esterase-like enzyme
MPIRIFLLVLACVVLALLPVQAQTSIPAQDKGTLTFGEGVLSELAGNGVDSWTFQGNIEQSLVLSAERFPPNPDSLLDPQIELYDSAGNLLISDDDSGPGHDALIIGFTLPKTDDYTVLVRNLESWEGGSYQLTVAENPLPADCESPFGTMIPAEMPSPIVGYPVRYRVFLPPCHEVTHQRYPYILLMHGSNTGDEHWDRLGMDAAIARGVALKRFPPVALVLPFGGELANINTFRESASWEYVVTDELMPHVEANYCLQTTRENRAIGGISRGGFWAFLIAFRHPELFTILGGHSPFFDLYHAPATHNPLDLSMGTPPQPSLRIWMDRGKDDYAQLNIDLQHERLTENNIEHEFMLYPVGQHEDGYWGAHLDDYLDFYTRDWPMTPEQPCDLPEVAVP